MVRAGSVVWRPDPELVASTGLARYLRWLEAERGLAFEGYHDLWRWSVDDLEAFWRSVWDFEDVQATGSTGAVLDDARMPGATWFPGTALNVAEHLLRRACPDSPALVAVAEDAPPSEVSWEELRAQAGALERTLRALGVGRGDRVVAYLPNVPEAIVGLVACASMGAIWSICAPDFAPAGVLSRFAQLDPAVLIASGGYRYAGREHLRHAESAEIAAGLPTLRHVIWVDGLGTGEAPPDAIVWDDAIATPAEPSFERVPFDHPLWVLFSSGTTGPPKGIVHGHGGIVLELLKNLRLQLDVREGDRVLMIASTSWMVWNVLACTLLAGATAVLLDGSPAQTWRHAADQRATLLGVGAGFLHANLKAGLRPRDELDLGSLRSVLSTGSALSPDGFAWIGEAVGPHVWPNSVSGGTDVCSALVAGSPMLPVRAGRIPAPCLGAAVEAWRDDGAPAAPGEIGELVVTRPMPSMPLALWGDADGRRYRESYFDAFPGVWRHGDLIEFDTDGSSAIHGRSDATLNRNGVRLGSAEIYAAVERLGEVRDSLVVGAELGSDYYMPLYVHLADGVEIDAARERIVAAIRGALSPRHVPDEIIAVPGVPRTRTGKKLEVPVKRLLQGADRAGLVDPGSVDRPELLNVYADLADRFRDERGGR